MLHIFLRWERLLSAFTLENWILFFRFFGGLSQLDGQSIRGAKGELFPAVSVRDGAKVVANFSRSVANFEFSPPAGFTGLVPHMDLI